MHQTKQIGFLSLSEEIYRVLLIAYPRTYRDEFGPHMALTFRDCLRAAYGRGGFTGLLGLWASTLLDLIKTAVEERAQRSIQMSRSILVRMAGPVLMVGGLLWMLSGIGQFETLYWDEFGGFDLIYEIGGMLMGVALLPLVIGLIGLHLGYKDRAGMLGRLGLLGPYVGIIVTLAVIAVSIFNPAVDIWWYGFITGLMLLMLGIALFGIDALRRQILSRWNFAPLVAGAPFPVVFGIAGILSLTTGHPVNITGWSGFIGFVITGLGWMMLGYVVTTDSQVESAPAV